jgi:hypothetical protein
MSSSSSSNPSSNTFKNIGCRYWLSVYLANNYSDSLRGIVFSGLFRFLFLIFFHQIFSSDKYMKIVLRCQWLSLLIRLYSAVDSYSESFSDVIKALMQVLLYHGLLKYSLIKLLFLPMYISLYFIRNDGIRLYISFAVRYILSIPLSVNVKFLSC